MGRKQQCANHKKHAFPLPSDEGSIFDTALSPYRNRVKLNKRILETATEFLTGTNLSCRQTDSPPMHEYILILIQTGACIQANHDAVLIDVA
jgi:hypothetical protein